MFLERVALFSMDFERFLQNPKEYIHFLAQNECSEPDLGIMSMLNNYFDQNPNGFFNLPIVSTLEDLQMTSPNQIVRLRCSLLEFSNHEMFVYRIFSNGEYFSCLFEENIPENISNVPNSALADRECFKAMTIRPMTEWYRNETAYKPKESTLKTYSSSKNQPKRVFNTPFEVTVKIAFDYENESNFDLIDFVGAFTEEAYDFSSGFGSYQSSLPTFIAFTFKPAIFLCKSLQALSNKELILSAYNITMRLLESLFEPLQAKFILMFLLTKVSSSFSGFVLNFNNCSAESVSLLHNLIEMICPLYQKIDLCPEELNKIDLKPSINEFGVEKDSSLLCSSGTTLLFDEIFFDDEELNRTGNSNVDLLRSIFYIDQIEASFYGTSFKFNLCSNILTLSNEKSIFPFDFSLPIGEISTFPEISMEQIQMIRYFIDRQRNVPFNISNEGKFMMNSKIQQFQSLISKSLSDKEKGLLILFMVNFAKASGEEDINEISCNSAIELFRLYYTNFNDIPNAEDHPQNEENHIQNENYDESQYDVNDLLAQYGELLTRMSTNQ